MTFVFVSLGGATDGMITSGIATFGPKIIESLFKLTASQSAISIGELASTFLSASVRIEN